MQPLEFIRKKPVIETERLIFRKMRVSDARDMYEYACKEETSRYLLWAPHSSYFYTVKLLRFLQGEYENGRFFDLAVIDKESGKVYGTVSEVEDGVRYKLYTVKTEGKDVILPGVSEFIKEIDTERGVFVTVIPGFFD